MTREGGAALLALLLFAASASSAEPSGEEVLRRAFENLYGYDLKMVLTLELQSGSGEISTRKSEVARKEIRGLTHSFAHFLEPPWMRGTRMLLVDNADRSDDVFLFLPESERVRRLDSVQRQDYFLGSDLWYEDLERRRVSDYRVIASSTGEEGVMRVLVVDALPEQATIYERVRFVVGAEDFVMRRIAFYRKGSDVPFREISFDPDSIVRAAGFLIPTRLVVTNHQRRTKTIVTFGRLEVNPDLSNALFRSTALLTKRRIPGLTDGANEDE